MSADEVLKTLVPMLKEYYVRDMTELCFPFFLLLLPEVIQTYILNVSFFIGIKAI